jgi:septal ring-binding cell division protein DamX
VKVIRENRAVFTVPAGKLGTASKADPTSFPVAGEISLNQFPPGQYTLQISATDKTDQTTVSQQIQFAIE